MERKILKDEIEYEVQSYDERIGDWDTLDSGIKSKLIYSIAQCRDSVCNVWKIFRRTWFSICGCCVVYLRRVQGVVLPHFKATGRCRREN